MTVCCNGDDAALLTEFDLEQFAALCIVSEVKLPPAIGEMTVAAQKSSRLKCQRCRNHRPSVGTHSGYAGRCQRCISVVRQP